MPVEHPVLPSSVAASSWLTSAGHIVSRYGLVIVLAWIGFGKYLKMEARVLIEHSPLMSWIYHFLSSGVVAASLGTAEIVAAILIALRPWWPTVSAVGSAMAIVLFIGTVSFLFTTPGLAVGHLAGVPILGAQPGQFLLKDVVLLGVSVWTLGESLGARGKRRAKNVCRWCLIGAWQNPSSAASTSANASSGPRRS